MLSQFLKSRPKGKSIFENSSKLPTPKVYTIYRTSSTKNYWNNGEIVVWFVQKRDKPKLMKDNCWWIEYKLFNCLLQTFASAMFFVFFITVTTTRLSANRNTNFQWANFERFLEYGRCSRAMEFWPALLTGRIRPVRKMHVYFIPHSPWFFGVVFCVYFEGNGTGPFDVV